MQTRTADDDRDHELRELAHREHLLLAQVRFANADSRARLDGDLAELRRQRVDPESR